MRLQIYHFNPNYDQQAQWIRNLKIEDKGKNRYKNTFNHLIIKGLHHLLKNYIDGEIAKA